MSSPEDGAGRLVLGTARNDDPAAARRAAMADALGSALHGISTTVSSRVHTVRVDDNGQVSATLEIERGMALPHPVEVRNAREERHCPGEPGGITYVQAFLPAAELARLRRQLEGRTVLALRCSSEPDGACEKTLAARIRTAARARGIALIDPGKPEDGAVRTLIVDVTGRFEAVEHDEYFAYADAQARIVDAETGTILLPLDALHVEGADWDELQATRLAIRNAVHELATKLEGGRP